MAGHKKINGVADGAGDKAQWGEEWPRPAEQRTDAQGGVAGGVGVVVVDKDDGRQGVGVDAVLAGQGVTGVGLQGSEVDVGVGIARDNPAHHAATEITDAIEQYDAGHSSLRWY
mgnify:CR=1 FL=1